METTNNIDLKLSGFKSHRGSEGEGFNADLNYKGVKIAHVLDQANGGEFRYEVLGEIIKDDKGKYKDSTRRDSNKRLFEKLEAEITKLPKRTMGEGVHQGGEPYKIQPDLDTIVDDLVNVLLMKKDQKKGILVKTDSGYSITGWNVSLPTILKSINGKALIQNIYDKLKAEKSDILNTEYLVSIGIKI